MHLTGNKMNSSPTSREVYLKGRRYLTTFIGPVRLLWGESWWCPTWLQELERICLPKLNVIMERQHFHHLEQEEDESISNSENRIRTKAMVCRYNACSCKENCYIMKCGFSKEEDVIFTQILCNMKDKELQKELRWKEETVKTLDEVMGARRANGVAAEDQSAMESQTSGFSKIKCYNCDKFGHGSRNCPTKKHLSKTNQTDCWFWGGPKRCTYKTCPAFIRQCRKCNKFAHVQ